tara:strand:- start:13712 stop:14647 length:936 start_codon:yes stop_codon:yes gene_type:complete
LEERKFKLLSDTLGRSYRNGEERLYHCPKCKHHKKKLSVNIARNVFKCWVCEYSGADIFKLIKRYASRSVVAEWRQFSDTIEISNFDKIFEVSHEEPEEVRLDLPKEFVSLTGEVTTSLLRPYKYLTSRGLTKEDIIRWKIGCCLSGPYANRIVVPSFDLDGRLNYFIARTYGDSYVRYKNPPTSKDMVFNEIQIDWGKPTILVEGVFDAMNAENSIPILGSSLNPKSKLFQKIVGNSRDVYVALDSDASEKCYSIARNLMLYDVNVHIVDTSGYEDVGTMSKEEFMELKNAASFVSLDDYLLYKTNAIWS